MFFIFCFFCLLLDGKRLKWSVLVVTLILCNDGGTPLYIHTMPPIFIVEILVHGTWTTHYNPPPVVSPVSGSFKDPSYTDTRPYRDVHFIPDINRLDGSKRACFRERIHPVFTCLDQFFFLRHTIPLWVMCYTPDLWSWMDGAASRWWDRRRPAHAVGG